jgi:two-component system response regulator AgrA
MENISVRLFIIEDNFIQRKIAIKMILDIFDREFPKVSLKIVDVPNVIEFYDRIPTIDFYFTDVFLIDYDLLTYFDGIDVAKKISNTHRNATIGFLTSYKDKAIDVINASVNTVGYVIKDVNSEKTKKNLEIFIKNAINGFLLASSKDQCIAISIGRITKLIPINDICYITTIKGERNKVFIRTLKTQLIANEKMKYMVESLTPFSQFSSFKFYIFNTERIIQYSRQDREIVFSNSESLYLGIKILDKLIKQL